MQARAEGRHRYKIEDRITAVPSGVGLLVSELAHGDVETGPFRRAYVIRIFGPATCETATNSSDASCVWPLSDAWRPAGKTRPWRDAPLHVGPGGGALGAQPGAH